MSVCLVIYKTLTSLVVPGPYNRFLMRALYTCFLAVLLD
jgi:hypothetical protein